MPTFDKDVNPIAMATRKSGQVIEKEREMPKKSDGLYRIPYERGTTVKVIKDHLTHNPKTRVDMRATGGRQPYLLVAAAAGVIRFIVDSFSENRPGASPCNNNYVWIEHANGEWTKYSHMTKGSVTADAGLSVGDHVNRGTFIGFEGDVGCASGNPPRHLHFEVGVPSNPSDPIDSEGFLRGGSAENRIPRMCGVPNETLIDGTSYTVEPCIWTVEGRVSFLRVHEIGGKFGPPGNQLDVEAVVKLESEPTMAFGFQLRSDATESVCKGMLDTVRTAFGRGRPVRLDYLQTVALGGVIIRVDELS